MRAPNTPFGLELSEFFDIARSDRAPNPWDPGASTLIFSVRDLDAVAGRLKARGAPVVTLGGAPVTTPGGRAMLVRDPDGCLIEIRQGDVIETSIGHHRGQPGTGARVLRDVAGLHRQGHAHGEHRGAAPSGSVRRHAHRNGDAIPGTAVQHRAFRVHVARRNHAAGEALRLESFRTSARRNFSSR